METSRAKFKLEEARFFLHHLREERGKVPPNWPQAFGFYLSAFLNAAYSVTECLEWEAKTELKKGAERKKQAKARFNEWREEWVKRLSPEERKVWDHMEEQRGAEVHSLGATTVTETKAVPIQHHPRSPASVYYFFQNFMPPPALFADAWVEEKRKTGLPLWADAWWEAQVHHFEIEDERHEVVRTCERYIALLQRLLDDFLGSDLTSGSPSTS